MGFVRGVTMGAVIGAAAGMLIVPQLDRNTRRKVRRTSRMVINAAGDIYDNMMRNMNR